MSTLNNKAHTNNNKEEIFQAILTNNLEQLKKLVTHENVNIKDRSGYTLLHIATNNEKTEIAKWLVSIGADVNLHCNSHTVLATALNKANFDLFNFYLENKAECIGRNQLNVLHEAANKNRYDIVVRLIEKGADPNLFNNSHITPLTIAIGHKNKEIIEFLLENGACANLPDKKGNTSLHLACSLVDPDVINCLLDNTECDLRLKNINEETCLDLFFVNLMKENKINFDFGLILKLIQIGGAFSMPWNYTLNQANFIVFLKLIAILCKYLPGRLESIFLNDKPFFTDLILTGYWKNSIVIAIKYAILSVQDTQKLEILIKKNELLKLIEIILFSEQFNLNKHDLLSTLYMFDDELDDATGSQTSFIPNFIYSFIKKCFDKPLSLKNLCRNEVRACLTDLNEDSIKKLKLKDTNLVEFLNFENEKT
ncbi:unnamed protein product [Brachionus calyciflorus]|uniref:Ankyrin repeat protein n=1 Tax=Brachionus calyciflorus TaxID=104777 RepID=A0A814G685_9BILA|nr:unnamed protein product [Brachionus calyciflorus]